MTHSNRGKLHWALMILEILVFVSAIVAGYLSQVTNWYWYIIVSVVSTVVYAAIKIFGAVPALKELLIREDMASRMALSAERYGVREYFNMQSSRDQALRNERTQYEIKRAQTLFLCANSGASFLDPGVYRHWQFVEQRLKLGVLFRVVLLDPFSEERIFRNQVNVAGENIDSKLNIGNLIRLHNTYTSLEIRFVKCGMHATVFATENCLFFDPYQVGVIGDRIENRSFSLRVDQEEPSEGVGLYRLFKSHFDTLWRSGVPISDWVETNRRRLPDGLPRLGLR